MSISYSGTISRSAGLVSAIGKQVKAMNLRGVKRVTISFDPFHEKAVDARNFLYHLSLPKVVATNPSCVIKTDIVCDRRPATVTFQLIPTVADQLKLKNVTLNGENLTTLELLQLTNKYVSAYAPKEEPVNVVKTKSEKKGAKRR